MKHYTGIQYLQIDLCNQWGHGLDKEQFEDRIDWVESNEVNLEDLAPQAKDVFRYNAALLAYRDAQKGIPTGYLCGLDASASGIGILGVLTGCAVTAKNTGVINKRKRDIYGKCTQVMSNILGSTVDVERDLVKKALMVSYYGSEAKPKELFGEDTPELDAFYKAAERVAPGANLLKGLLLNAWQPDALFHSWTMPDGFECKVPVLEKMVGRLEVDELDHAQINMLYEDNIGTDSGLSLVANVTHSVDGYVLRQVVRRCNFDVLGLHDEFFCHPNNMNHLRQAMIDVMADLADSNLASDLLSQITGSEVVVPKFCPNLGDQIRESEYIIS